MAIRILDVLNFSNAGNPLADSGIQLQRGLIQAALRTRPDLFFYLLIPQELEGALQPLFPQGNTKLVPCSLVSRQKGGAYHFDARELSSLLDLRRIDVDVLFINQPELTAAFLNYFNKIHFFDIHSVGYIHWMDWRPKDNVKNRWNLPENLALLTSVLMSDMTACNSHFGKTQIVREAAKWFNAQTVKEIDNKLVPLWPGIDSREISAASKAGRNRSRHKTIIAPYRTQKYTGFKSLIEVHLAKLWRKRRDFRLVLTNPSEYNYVKKYPQRYPFVEIRHCNRREYLEALWKADIVVGCHTGACQWSIAAVEAIAAECIPLLNQECFLKEMLLEALPATEHAAALDSYFYYRSNFIQKLENILDGLSAQRERVRRISKWVRTFYDWDRRVFDWVRCFEAADAAANGLRGESNAVGKIDEFVASRGACTKEEILRLLGWHPKSRHISWTRYRKYLRTKYWEDPASPEVTFFKNRAGK